MSQPPHGPWPSYPPPPPVRKSHTGLIVAACLAGVVLLGLSIVVIAVSGGRDPRLSASGSTALTTTSAPGTTSWHPSSTTPRTVSPTGRATTGTPTTEAGPHKIITLADHPLTADPVAGLRNAPCSVPGWPGSPAAAQTFFTAAVQCLNARWSEVLTAMGLPFHPPQLEFPNGDSFTSPCGTIEVSIAIAAFYCKDHLYVPWRGLQTDLYGNRPGVYLALFAHEYGHHVQELVGLMDAAWSVIYQEGEDTPAGLEMSRRKELQAQCFSGLFLGSTANRGGTVTQKVFDTAWNDQETRGDDTSGSHDHGANAHYAAWWRKGARSDRLAQCNTFAAPSSDVS